MNHNQFLHPSSALPKNNLIRAPFLSPPTKITQPKTHIDTPVVTHKPMFHPPSLQSGTQDDSVLNNRDRLRRQHMRTNMPSTPTLPKTNHFQENINPQQQQQQSGAPGTSFTIEIATAPKKGPPQHLLERLSKKTSIAKTVKDSEMGDGVPVANVNNTTTQQTTNTTTNRRHTILEFQKRKSTGLKQNSLLNKPNDTSTINNNLTYTTFDTNGLTLDDDLETGFEKSGSPILSLNPPFNAMNPPQASNMQHATSSGFAFGSQSAQQQTNVNTPSNQPPQQGFQFGQPNTQSNPQWQMEQQHLEQQKLEQQRMEQHMAEQKRAAEQQLLQQQQLEQQRMAEQQRLRDQQQQQQLEQMNEQQRANAEQQILQQKQMEQQRMLEQQRIEQEKLQQQFGEQQRLAEHQRVEQQQMLQQQQMWQQAQSNQMQFIPVYQSVPSEETQRLLHDIQRQQAEFERQRVAHMEMMQRERAELEMSKELIKRQQIELQSKLNEVEQMKIGILKQPVNERRDSGDARRNEVESMRADKRTAQRQEIVKSKRELNLLNVDKLSRASREIKREEREEEKRRTRSVLPQGIFSPKSKPPVSRISMFGTRSNTPSSSIKSETLSRKPLETPNSMYSPVSSMKGSVRSSVSATRSTTSREMSSPSGILSKRKQMVLEKTRRKAEEFSRKSNNNTPCQH